MDRLGKSLPMHLHNVTQVEIAASVITDLDKPPRTVPIRLTYPNACSLKYNKVGIKLREMMEASGIEPKQPAETEQAEEASNA